VEGVKGITTEERSSLIATVAQNEKMEATVLAEQLGFKVTKTRKGKGPKASGNWYTIRVGSGYPDIFVKSGQSGKGLFEGMNKAYEANKKLPNPTSVATKAAKKAGADAWLEGEAKNVVNNPDLTANGLEEVPQVAKDYLTRQLPDAQQEMQLTPKEAQSFKKAEALQGRIDRVETVEELEQLATTYAKKLGDGTMTPEVYDLVTAELDQKYNSLTGETTKQRITAIRATANLEDLHDVVEGIPTYLSTEQQKQLSGVIAEQMGKLETRNRNLISGERQAQGAVKRTTGNDSKEVARRISKEEHTAMTIRTVDEAALFLPAAEQKVVADLQASIGQVAQLKYAAEITGNRAEQSITLDSDGYAMAPNLIIDVKVSKATGDIYVQTVNHEGQFTTRPVAVREAYVVEGSRGGKFVEANNSHIARVDKATKAYPYKLSDDGKDVIDTRTGEVVEQTKQAGIKTTEVDRAIKALEVSTDPADRALAATLRKTGTMTPAQAVEAAQAAESRYRDIALNPKKGSKAPEEIKDIIQDLSGGCDGC
jgi:hypothetical protein